MKRFLCIFLTGLLLLGGCGCEPTTPYKVTAKGYPYTVSEENEMTIMDAFVEGNSIVVKLSATFPTTSPKTLTGIAVRKSEVEQPYITCDMERTKERNGGEDVFVQAESGNREFFLVFTDTTIRAETQLSNYILAVPVGQNETGTIVLQDAMALG